MTIPNGNGDITVGYYIGTDFQSSASVWASSAGQYIGNGNAGYNTWLTGTAPVRLASVTAVSSNGSGNYRLSVSSPTVFSDFTTGQVLTFADDNNNIPASITVVSSLLIDLSTTSYSSGTTFTTSDAGLFGPPAYTTASIAAQINAYNQSLISPTQGQNVINSSINVILTNPVISYQNVTATTSSVNIIMPQANLFGSPALGRPIYFENSGLFNFIVARSSDLAGIVTVPAGSGPAGAFGGAVVFLSDNSSQKGIWRALGYPPIPNSVSPGNLPIDQGVNNGYASFVITGDATLTSSGFVQVTKTSSVAFGPYATASTGQLPGTATNDNAAAGDIGEYITATSSATAQSNNTGVALTSVSLTGGDWDVWANVSYGSTSPTTTLVSILAPSIANSSGTIDTGNIDRYSETSGFGLAYFNFANAPTQMVGPTRVTVASTSSPATYWINNFVTWGGAGPNAINATGKIEARRAR